jgi:DNA-binding IclR family transcriptional regulator
MWPAGQNGTRPPPYVAAVATGVATMPPGERPPLSDAVCVLAFLARWHHVDGQPITESVRQIAAATTLSTRKVRRCLAALEAADLVTTGRRGGRGRGTERWLELGPL